MTTAAPPTTITVALLGNPNTGKSTLFSALAGVRQRVGNYPGVTVEKKIGQMHHEGGRFTLVDLPGTYSLAPRSPDEMVAVDVLLGRRDDVGAPDVILSIVDASNLERNLYLVSQVLELGRPTVVALNMTDVAGRQGIEIDAEKLAERLGVPVIPIQANRRRGIAELKSALAAAAASQPQPRVSIFSETFHHEVFTLKSLLDDRLGEGTPRYLVERFILDSGGYVEAQLLAADHDDLREAVRESRRRLADAGEPVPAVEAMARYGWIHETLDGVVRRPRERRVTGTDRIDRILTHKVTGTLIFAAMMLLVFSSIFSFATPAMDEIGEGQEKLGNWVGATMPDGPLQSLLVDGIIGGVGAVVIFLPQILILFFFIALLEDCGYMARAAYLMDKLMVRAGLSGKSFIPLLSSFACAVPGIMAARVIEDRRDRLTTILVAPLMSCSARLPVYIILIAAFIPQKHYLGGLIGLQGLTMFAMYLVGIVTAVFVALLLKRTLLKGETPPFVMELPSYKWPSPAMVLYRMGDRGWAFIRRAGTIIFAVTIVIWAVTYYPRNDDLVEKQFTAQHRLELARLERLPESSSAHQELQQELANARASIQQRHSYLGQAGQWIEPVVRPLGWDWRIGSAAIASFPAREVVMGVLGVIYSLGEVDVGDEEQQRSLAERLQQARWDDTGKPVYNIPVALSIMVFFALCAQCAATLATIRRETNSWRWPIFTFVYMTGLAYLGAFVTYQIGMQIITAI